MVKFAPVKSFQRKVKQKVGPPKMVVVKAHVMKLRTTKQHKLKSK